MGDIDINIKNFIKINSVFAQLFEKWVYGGEVFIDPDKLQELDTASQETMNLGEGQLKGIERLRDAQKISMLFDGKMAFQKEQRLCQLSHLYFTVAINHGTVR